ncbi:hypothetical protein SAMN04489740_3728 [Arthrobacter alpinus]|uniref:Uncharacterized protein n=1 Tax=Arthrobacter alpinus TaxID=656366 RepID=A0A1H5NHV4_9MICC|nr:hypothetical protein [Arthrobacter alpinus]SEF01229.1 hypothetical protein SAMN04489740_3728 [Arthrobacter alpinus]
MSQQEQPGLPVQQQINVGLAEAYRQGYLEGHLAGWKDALAAQAQVTAVPLAVKQPPNVMPTSPAFGHGTPVQPAPPGPQQTPIAPTPAVQQQHLLPEPRPMPVGQTFNPVYPVQMATQPAKPLSPEAAAARKAKRENQNINITLYVASLLMVAAAALFVGSNVPVPVRLFGVWAGTALFYVAGLVLHSRIARLKPAAVAFTGTALAIIPFAGLATYNLGFPEAPFVWLLTSLIGTVAYVVAAVQLNSRLVVYLSLAFLLSTAWSSVAVLGAALAWYFTALIVFSALLSLAGYLLKRRAANGSGGLGLYAKPLSDLGPWFTPVGLAGSLAFGLSLNAADHALVLVAGAIFYAVMTFISMPSLKRFNYVGLRVSLTLAAPFIGWMMQPELAWAAGAFTVVIAIQILLISYAHERIGAYLRSAEWARWDVWGSIPALTAGSLLWSLGWYWVREGNGGEVPLAAVGVGVALVVSMEAVPAFLPRGEWFPLPALGAVLLFSPFLTAGGWTAILAVSLCYSTLRYLRAASGVLKQAMLVVARILATALVASVLATFVPEYPGKAHLIIAVTAVVSALQLAADTLLTRVDAANPITKYSAAAWTLTGTFLVAVLSVLYFNEKLSETPDPAVMEMLRVEFLVTAVVMAIAVALHSLSALPRQGGWVGAEVLAPSYFIVVALFTGPVFAASGASVAWAATMGYLIIAGLRLLRSDQTGHRWLYWWGARGVWMLLVVALFQLWVEKDPQAEIGDTELSLGLVLLLAMVVHLAILTGAVRSGHNIPGLPVDVYVTLSAVAVTGVLSVIWQPTGLWTTLVVFAVVTAAVGVLAVAATTHRDPAASAVWAAPAAMIALALCSIAHRPQLAIVLAFILAVSAVLAAKSSGPLVRGAHFLLTRVSVTVLVGVLVREMTADLAIVSLALTCALLAQVVLQYIAGQQGRFNAAVGEANFLWASLWLLLTAQTLVPVTYHLASGGFGSPGGALRWVVAVELLVLAVTSLVAQALLKQRGASFMALVAVMGGAAVMAPVLWPGATALILLALTVAVIAWRCLYTPKTTEMRWYWIVATGCFLVTACVVDSEAATGIFAGMWLVAGLALIVGAHLMKLPWLTLPGSLMVLLAAVLFRAQVLDLSASPGYSALAGFAVLLGTLYVVRLLSLDLADDRQIQRGSLVGTALAGGVFFALWSMFDNDVILLGACAFTLVAVLTCVEAPAALRRLAVDASVVGCAGVWFVACSKYVDLGLFWAVLWCAFALGGLAVIRYLGQQQEAGKGLLLGAATVASFAAVLTIYSGDTLQQLISLLVFVALLAVGLSLDERVFTIWGAIGVATAVLWYLRGFTYIMLALLALGLIGFAIWRLNRKKPADGAPVPTQVLSDAPDLPHG